MGILRRFLQLFSRSKGSETPSVEESEGHKTTTKTGTVAENDTSIDPLKATKSDKTKFEVSTERESDEHVERSDSNEPDKLNSESKHKPTSTEASPTDEETSPVEEDSTDLPPSLNNNKKGRSTSPVELSIQETAEDLEKQLPDLGTETHAELSSSEFAKLSGFRRDCLVVLSGMKTPKGLEIKKELEKYYDGDINHGRLYPNLDKLVEKNLVEKVEVNARSNGYNLTEHGKILIHQRKNWEVTQVGESIENKFSSQESVDSSSTDQSSKPQKEQTGDDQTNPNKESDSVESAEVQETENGDEKVNSYIESGNGDDITRKIMTDLEDKL